MSKSMAKLVAVTFILFVVFLLTFNNNYAKTTDNNSETANWKVYFTNEGKDIKETKEIKFRSVENNYVVPGKIAPGTKMKAEVEINIEKTDTPVEINAEIDESNLEKVFSIKATIDDDEVDNNTPAIANKGEKKILILELEWKENDSYDMEILDKKELSIPIKIEIYSHI